MVPISPLFTVPIGANGSVVCTQPAQKVYLLTFSSPPDNRLTPDFCKALTLALDIIEHKLPKGVVVTTSAIGKFYSNGLDFENAIRDPNFFKTCLYPFWRRLLTYPMPTIALINGHAFAAALMTAMMHDYRFMNPHRGYLCLNELDFGAPLKPPMASIFRSKLGRPDVYRTMVLESKRFNALEALKGGIVDGLGSWEELSAFVAEMKLIGRAESGVYGRLKEEMYRDTTVLLDRGMGTEEREELDARSEASNERELQAQREVESFFSGRRGKTKL